MHQCTVYLIYIQHRQRSVGVVSLAIFEQSVAIFDFSDEHIDDKYSEDLLKNKPKQPITHDCHSVHAISILLCISAPLYHL